jgi:hypothetical protein
MSLEKAIFHKKEKRKPYYGRTSKVFDFTCRNNGKCPYCRNSRLHGRKKAEIAAKTEIKEWTE